MRAVIRRVPLPTRSMYSSSRPVSTSPSSSSAAIISVQLSTAANGLRRSWATTSANAVRSTRRACSTVASRKISSARARPVSLSRGSGAAETARIRPAPGGPETTSSRSRTVPPAEGQRQRVAGAGRRGQQRAQVTGQAADPGGSRVAQQPLAGVVDDGQPLGHRVDHGVEELGLVGHLARALDQLSVEGTALVEPGRQGESHRRGRDHEELDQQSVHHRVGLGERAGALERGPHGEVPQHEQVQGGHQGAEPDPAPDQRTEDQEEQGRGVEDEDDDVHRDAREAGGHELEGAALPEPGPRTGLGEVVEEQQPGRGDEEDAADVASRSTAARRARCRGRRPASTRRSAGPR